MTTVPKIILLTVSLTFVASCGLGGVVEDQQSPEDRLKYGDPNSGKLFGDITIWGGKKKEGESEQRGLSVNAVAWKATLDVLSFLPLVSADPFSGIIITDWYSEDDHQDERFKINAFIEGRALRSDSIKVSVFKQVKNKSGEWLVVDPDADSARKIENAILQRAREINIKNNN
jgi:hypothetical protein